MGLIKVLPEHKKRKRVKREVEQVATKKEVATPTSVKQKEKLYPESKQVHVTMGEGEVDFSKRPKEYGGSDKEQEQVPVITTTTGQNSSSEATFESPNSHEKGEEKRLESQSSKVAEDTIVVPELFMKWLEVADRTQGVFKAYNALNNEGEHEVIDWVDNHQDEFVLIWKGELIPEVEEALYETAMFNYGKYPNVLVKTQEGKIMMKIYEDMLPTDELHLTEEEIRKDWTFLFENGFSKRVYFE